MATQSNEKVVYWVTAPENSGNHMMLQCLCSAGYYGNLYIREWFGASALDVDFRGRPDKLAFLRSFPHGGQVIDPYPIAVLMQAEGYRIVPITVHRKSEFAIEGQVLTYAGRTSEEAQDIIRICQVTMHEFAAWLKTPLIVVPYEPFVRWREVRVALFAQIGLPAPTYATFNANESEKYKLEGPPLTF